jgi:hypothetical protein
VRKIGLLTVAALFGLAVTSGSAGAVTDGEFDGDGHPFVGLMVGQVEDPNTGLYVSQWRCSGTLISPTVFLTAGHCTFGADRVEIWFDADVESNRAALNYPFAGDVGGVPHTHPDYDDGAFVLRDVGVVVLDEPVEMDEYGKLPELNQLDALKTRRGKQNVGFTAVGYGLQRINPVFVESELVRQFATPKLLQINTPGFTGDFSLLLSNNHSTGGTCFGDSGGPNFLGDSNVIAGVTSFGINGNCAGTGGVFRMDRSWALDFVESHL